MDTVIHSNRCGLFSAATACGQHLGENASALYDRPPARDAIVDDDVARLSRMQTDRIAGRVAVDSLQSFFEKPLELVLPTKGQIGDGTPN